MKLSETDLDEIYREITLAQLRPTPERIAIVVAPWATKILANLQYPKYGNSKQRRKSRRLQSKWDEKFAAFK